MPCRPMCKQTARELIDHYRDMHERESIALVKYTIQQAIRKYHAGSVDEATIDKMVEWVRSGDAAANKGTQVDKDFRQILGKSADTIAAIKELRRIDGIYVPLTRRGKFFISATETPYGTLGNPKNLPAGASADASQKATKSDPDPIVDKLLFKDRASLDAFTASSDEMVSTGTLWIDPKTGKTVTKDFQVADPSVPGGLRVAKPVYVATIQNKRMEMSDNLHSLEKRRKELLAQGHKVAKVRQTKQMMENRASEVTSSQLQRLMDNLGQTTLGKHHRRPAGSGGGADRFAYPLADHAGCFVAQAEARPASWATISISPGRRANTIRTPPAISPTSSWRRNTPRPRTSCNDYIDKSRLCL